MSGTGKVKSNQNRQRKILEPQIKGEILKNENITLVIFNSPGEDSRPLPDDFFAYIDALNIGKKIAVGFLDTKNEPSVEAGEKKIYSRDSDGNIKAVIYLKKDGTIEINEADDFAISHTQLQILLSTFATSINANFTAIAASLTSLSPPVPYAPVPVSIDILAAKIDEIKLPSP